MVDQLYSSSLASYFVLITGEFAPLDGPPPTTYSSSFELPAPHEIAARIRSTKKAKFAVEGDVLPVLASKFSDITAVPATRIINFLLAAGIWPESWRLETQTAIPKKDEATDFDMLRNLSCTNSLPKIMESFVLENLRSEVQPRMNQFDGIKGHGPNHILVECWDFILSGLDEQEPAVSFLS